MWISKKIALDDKQMSIASSGDIIDADSGVVSVQNSNEYRNIEMISPYGIAYNPVPGERAVMLSIGDLSFCAGIVSEDKGLSPGELMLYSSGGASIVLKNDGRVLINGSSVNAIETTGGE